MKAPSNVGIYIGRQQKYDNYSLARAVKMSHVGLWLYEVLTSEWILAEMRRSYRSMGNE